jgi:hypothetical protein
MTSQLLSGALTLLLVISAVLAGDASAQPAEQASPNIELETATRSRDVTSVKLNERLEEMYVEHNELALRQIEAESRHRIWTLWYQYIASWLILASVITIVATGLRMSWKQLTKELSSPGSSPSGASAPSTFKFSSTEISVSSPVIGLVVFLASTLFFYIYITQVFPISVIEGDKPSQTISAPEVASTDAKES